MSDSSSKVTGKATKTANGKSKARSEANKAKKRGRR
jgi:hypothetical protein